MGSFTGEIGGEIDWSAHKENNPHPREQNPKRCIIERVEGMEECFQILVADPTGKVRRIPRAPYNKEETVDFYAPWKSVERELLSIFDDYVRFALTSEFPVYDGCKQSTAVYQILDSHINSFGQLLLQIRDRTDYKFPHSKACGKRLNALIQSHGSLVLLAVCLMANSIHTGEEQINSLLAMRSDRSYMELRGQPPHIGSIDQACDEDLDCLDLLTEETVLLALKNVPSKNRKMKPIYATKLVLTMNKAIISQDKDRLALGKRPGKKAIFKEARSLMPNNNITDGEYDCAWQDALSAGIFKN